MLYVSLLKVKNNKKGSTTPESIANFVGRLYRQTFALSLMRPDVQSCENLAGKHSNKCEVYNFLSSKSG
jgi:hypothetical protein